MKCLTFSFLIALITVFSSCSSSNEDNFMTITPSIAFVHEDGSPVAQNECINPTTNYALLIKANANGKGNFKATTIEYTLNGTPNVITFYDDKQQLIGIKLNAGYNIAEIVKSDYKAILYFNSHENFELVP
jgi:hypothetical protein